MQLINRIKVLNLPTNSSSFVPMGSQEPHKYEAILFTYQSSVSM